MWLKIGSELIQRILNTGVLLGWYLSFSLSALAADLAIKSYVDKTVIGLNQQFTLSVELSGKDANSVPNPQIPNMDNFAAYLGSGSSQNIQFINGKMSVSKTISYHFQATALGKFQIDPVSITHKGKKYQTNPISIEIQQSSTRSQTSPKRDSAVQSTKPAEGDLFLRVFVNKRQVYQNEPVIVTYKIYTCLNISSYGYSKLPGTAGFWVEEFPIAQPPETVTEILEGKRYTVVTIKKMALFPTGPGTKTIEPMSIECDVRVRRRSRDIFDDFFSDSFFGRTVRKVIQSKTVNLKVLPLPEEGKPKDFSGIVGRYKINSWVDKNRIKTNEAVSYKLKIDGQGNIRTLPEMAVSFPTDFEVYPPKVTESINRRGTTISGNKIYEYVLVPRASGPQKIKPFKLCIFDPISKSYKFLQTSEIVINVAKGDEKFTAVTSGLSKEEIKLVGQDVRFIKTDIQSFQKIGVTFHKKFLFWLVLVVPLLCLAGAVGYRGHLDRIHGDIAYARERRANRAVRKRLSLAKSLLKESSQNEFYAEVEKALTGFLGDKLNISEAGMMTDEVQKMLHDKGVDKESIDGYFECLNLCGLKRYSPTSATETEMKDFLKSAERAIGRLDRKI